MTEFMDRQIRLQRAGQKEYTEEEVRLIINGAIQEEREACARMADECVEIEKLGEAIRTRGRSEKS